MKRRIFYSDNSVLTDMTVNLNSYHSGVHSFSFVSSEDAFFIGSRFPFNHIFIKLDGDNVNSNGSSMMVSYWGGKEFKSVVDIIDETSSNGKTLAKSGFVTWVTDKSYSWIKEDTNYSSNSVEGLTDVEIYDKYWLKITFSNDLTANTSFSWIGQKFCDDNALGSEYPALVRSSIMTAYEAGKTSWEEQCIRASEILVNDLVAKKFILSKDQILSKEDFELATVSKTAEIIYSGLGDDYKDDKSRARIEYEDRLTKSLPFIDTNKNARIDLHEQITQGRLVR